MLTRAIHHLPEEIQFETNDGRPVCFHRSRRRKHTDTSNIYRRRTYSSDGRYRYECAIYRAGERIRSNHKYVKFVFRFSDRTMQGWINIPTPNRLRKESPREIQYD